MALSLRRTGCLALVLCTACGPKLDGEWEGQLDFISIAGDVRVTNAPVHVQAKGDTLTISGAPFTQCTPTVTRSRGYAVDLGAGRCKFQSAKRGELVVPDAVESMQVTATGLHLSFYPPHPPASTAPDVGFAIRAHRAGSK